MFTRTACPRAVRRRSCEPEGETCARKHEQIVRTASSWSCTVAFPASAATNRIVADFARGAVPAADCAIIAHTRRGAPCTDGPSDRNGGN
jgi:hypothetical protein